MITRIEIDGFKSLRNVAFDLEPLTAIVGPNGSGKSNIVEALSFLSRLAAGFGGVYGTGWWRGTFDEQFARVPEAGLPRMRFAIEFELAAQDEPSACRYEVALERTTRSDGSRALVIDEERMTGFAAGGRQEDSGRLLFGRDRDDDPDSDSYAAEYPDQTLLSMAAGIVDASPVAEAVVEALRNIAFMHCHPAPLRASSDPTARPGLEHDGGNLPTTFEALDPAARAAVLAGVADLVPGLTDIKAQRGADDLLALRFAFDGDEYPARLVSDGTLRALALLTMAERTTGRGTAVVEEPENGIHPAALRRLIAKLRAATEVDSGVPPQFILVSHSPAIVAALADQPESLRFAELTRSGDGARYTRLLHVRREGEAPDQGRTNVSLRHVERLLATASHVAGVR
jgi:predicted ATPase